MSTKHTPGPWFLRKARTHFYIEAKHRLIAMVRYLGKAGSAWTSEADARLVAAAPELLDACIWAEMHLKRGDYSSDQVRTNVVNALSAAITRATGASHE